MWLDSDKCISEAKVRASKLVRIKRLAGSRRDKERELHVRFQPRVSVNEQDPSAKKPGWRARRILDSHTTSRIVVPRLLAVRTADKATQWAGARRSREGPLIS
jgi:hypothetical protein